MLEHAPFLDATRSAAQTRAGTRIPAVFKRYRAFLGPAFLVSVGYVDPGNWGTDLQAGAQYRYGLLWVAALSSVMAAVMQLLAARLGIVTGKNLAETCRDVYPAWCSVPLWIMCEIAIAACDLAEVLGSAVAINLLFHVPLFPAVVMTAADVLLLLLLQRHGMRLVERTIIVLVLTIAAAFFVELFVLSSTRPDLGEIGQALVHPALSGGSMTSVAVAIIGATVMPHNLYLHSALVQDAPGGAQAMGASRKDSLRINGAATIASLLLACLINAAIVILAAMVFHGQSDIVVGGHRYLLEDGTDWIRLAYLTVAPALGSAVASVVFATALLASGQSSSITGTLAGQVVMEGFTHWRISPWKRRAITRVMAIVPALLLIGPRGDAGVGDLLILSQVVLALQLPFAMFPLLHVVTSRRRMGDLPTPGLLLALGWGSALVITAFELVGLPSIAHDASRTLFGS